MALVTREKRATNIVESQPKKQKMADECIGSDVTALPDIQKKYSIE
jgi:hypothetical protein